MGVHGHRPENGVLDLKLEFLNPTPDPISLFILGESIHYILIKYQLALFFINSASYENVITVENQQISLDYTL